MTKRCYIDDGRGRSGLYPSAKLAKDDLWAEYHKTKQAVEGELRMRSALSRSLGNSCERAAACSGVNVNNQTQMATHFGYLH